MKSDGGFMRARYKGLLLVLVSVGFLVFYKSQGRVSHIPIDQGGSELQIRGRAFRAEVDSQSSAMAKADARRTYDLKDVCKKYFPKGMLFSDVEIILSSAGAVFDKSRGSVLGPDYNHSLPPDSPDRNDVSGGFFLEQSFVSNSVFMVIFRPQNSNAIPKKVGGITGCFVRSTNL